MNWQKIKLGDVAEKITKGTTPTTIGFDFENDGVNFIKVESIGNFGLFIKDSFAYISEKCHSALLRSQIQEGDILFSIAGAIGRIALVNEEILPANTNQALAIIRLENEGIIKRRYLTFYLEHLVESGYFDMLMSGVAQKNISLQQLNDLMIQTPDLETQEKIVVILEKWDAAIENLKQQIRKEEKFLVGFRKDIFSKKVNLFGIDCDWERKELKQIACIRKGTQLSKIYMVENGSVPVINGGINPSGKTESTNMFADAITISEGGNSCGYVNYIKEDFWLGGHCYAVSYTHYDKEFLYHLLKYNQRKIMSLRVGSGLPNIQKETLENFIIEAPRNINVQHRIAEFCKTQDQKIALLRQKLSNYESQRKYLLNRLLSGKEDI